MNFIKRWLVNRIAAVRCSSWLGVMVSTIRPSPKTGHAALWPVAICNPGWRNTSYTCRTANPRSRSLAGLDNLDNGTGPSGDGDKLRAAHPRPTKRHHHAAKKYKAALTLARMIKLGILACLMLPLANQISPLQTKTAQALAAAVCLLLSMTLEMTEACFESLIESWWNQKPYAMTPNAEVSDRAGGGARS